MIELIISYGIAVSIVLSIIMTWYILVKLIDKWIITY